MANFVERKLSLTLVFWAMLVLTLTTAAALAQNPPTEPPANTTETDPVQAMIEALKTDLLNSKADPALRYQRARLLLQNPHAHHALLDILTRSNNIDAKDIICRAIADQPAALETLNQTSTLPKTFIEPLFKLLLDENQRLALRAAQALAKCHDGVVQRLAAMLRDPQKPIAQRHAAITALEQIPGKQPVMALASVLQDPQPAIRDHALQALATILQLPRPVDAQGLKKTYLPLIEQTTEQAFIRWQFDRAVQRSHALRHQLTDIEKDYFMLLTQKFQATTDLQARLDLISRHLHNTANARLRRWAAEQIRYWKDVSTAQDGLLAEALLEMLVPFIADEHPQVRLAVAQALPSLGKTALPTASRLLEQLKQENQPSAQIEQLAALGAFEYTPVLQQALALARSKQPPVVAEAVRTLGKIAGAKEKPLTAHQIEQIVKALTQTYHQRQESADVKDDLIVAMRRIAAQPDYHTLAAQYFDQILRGALADPSEVVRQHAVKSLTFIHRQQVLPLLLEPKNLLNDPDTAVRFVVVQAMQDYPDKAMLKPLKNRLDVEDNPGTARDIRAAYVKILQAQPLQLIVATARQLQNDQKKNNELQSLFDSVMGLLAGKIVQAKNEGQNVPVEYQVLVLTHQAGKDIRSEQPAQALHRYNALLSLQLPQKQKERFRDQVLQIALDHPADAAFLTQARTLIEPLFAPPQANATLQRIEQTIEQKLQNGSLSSAVALMIYLVGPPETLPPSLQSHWHARANQLTLKLLDTIKNQLKSKTGQVDPKAIEMLGRLDNRFADYPADQPVQNQLEALARYRQLLQKTPPAEQASNKN